MASSNNNILYPLFEIQELVTKMQAYDLSALSDDALIQLRKDADRLYELAHVAVSQSRIVGENSD